MEKMKICPATVTASNFYDSVKESFTADNFLINGWG